jgi:hypothetical protein
MLNNCSIVNDGENISVKNPGKGIADEVYIPGELQTPQNLAWTLALFR